jgi:hypothetical protein
MPSQAPVLSARSELLTQLTRWIVLLLDNILGSIPADSIIGTMRCLYATFTRTAGVWTKSFGLHSASVVPLAQPGRLIMVFGSISLNAHQVSGYK